MKNSSPLMAQIKVWVWRHHKLLIGILEVLCLPLIYFFVYETGGIKFVFSHTMYIPIMIGGVFFGLRFGLVYGLVAGVLLGPLMPIDVSTGEPQLWYNWIYRLIIFTAIGGLSGYASNTLRQRAATIKQLFSHHSDTLIPNKNSFQTLQPFDPATPKTVFTLFINNYDKITDIFGVEITNQLLTSIYETLRNGLGQKSIIVLAESNKFWVVINHRSIDDDIALIMAIINRHIIIKDIPLYVDFSIGLSILPHYEDCCDFSMFIQSDLSARHAQLNNLPYVVYDDIFSKQKSDFELLGTFTEALATNQTYLAYQPIIDLQTAEIVSFEGLIRWNHPKRDLIMPDSFIPLVEQTQLIHDLTKWVIQSAMKEHDALLASGFQVAIGANVSAKNLHNPEFVKYLLNEMFYHQTSPSNLIIEITESSLMSKPEEMKVMLTRMKKQGFRIAIDDFGIGYSSLSYLAQFPIDFIKIDRYFSQNITTNPSIYHIVESTINLAHDLSFKVVAEGIENQKTLLMLHDLGCDYGQGFHIAKPMNTEALIPWINQYNQDVKPILFTKL